MLRWLWQRWPSVLAVVACAVLGASLALRRAPPRAAELPAADALGAISIQVVAELPACASDAGACGQPPTFAADGGTPAPGLSGARVRVFAVTAERHVPWAELTTDARGSARVPARDGDYWLLVDAAGHARRSELVTVAGASSRALFVLPSAVPLSVEVRDAGGRAIGGATVLVRADDELPHGALTGADGTARFEHVGKRVESLRASAES